MKFKELISPFLFVSLVTIFIACNGKSENDAASTVKEDSNGKSGVRPPGQSITKGKGSLSFKLDGQLYQTDPKRTKCWTTGGIPLAMLMAVGDGLTISWQMGYTEGETSYKLDGDSKGTINFTIGDKTYWGRGYGTDAVRVLLDYAFRHHNLHRVYLSVNSTNPRAIGAYRRCGFVEEGRLRAHAWSNGQYIDLVQMGILREEWAATEKA